MQQTVVPFCRLNHPRVSGAGSREPAGRGVRLPRRAGPPRNPPRHRERPGGAVRGRRGGNREAGGPVESLARLLSLKVCASIKSLLVLCDASVFVCGTASGCGFCVCDYVCVQVQVQREAGACSGGLFGWGRTPDAFCFRRPQGAGSEQHCCCVINITAQRVTRHSVLRATA